MRKFYLKNGNYWEKDLQKANLFFHKPGGLGTSDDVEYTQTGQGFFYPTNRTYEQPSIAGEIVIFKNHYKEYEDLINLLYTAQDLQLVYVPQANRELVMDVDVESVELSEITGYGTLEIPISFHGKSPYYLKNPIQKVFRPEEGLGAMRFPFRFPFIFSASGTEMTQIFSARGHFPAAIELVANGPLANPVLTVKNKFTEELYGKLDLAGLLLSKGEKLKYSSRPNMMGVWKSVGEGENEVKENLAPMLDLANNNFFQIPANTIVEATLTAEIDPNYTEPIIPRLSVYEYFRG